MKTIPGKCNQDEFSPLSAALFNLYLFLIMLLEIFKLEFNLEFQDLQNNQI